jgi:SAM-dependent methyltransferase
MDELAIHNQARWEALAEARIAYTCPWLDLDIVSARERVDPEGVLDEITGTNVLCLAAGGGQQSAAFALLGSHVTVFDLCATQLRRDEEAAKHFSLNVTTIQGDMRDLSVFPSDSFDLVWQAHSFAFVPDPGVVFDGVARVLRGGGQYRLTFTNPFVPLSFENSWNGTGYVQSVPYVDGSDITDLDPSWEFRDDAGVLRRVEGPREFRHALGPMINGLIARGFDILGFWEDLSGDPGAQPGSWKHFTAVFPPWLTVWSRLRKATHGKRT